MLSGIKLCITIFVFSHTLFHLHSSCFILKYSFSSVLYFGINNSCSNNITHINQIFFILNQVVIIFVQIMISALSIFSRAFSFRVLFFTESASKRNIIFSGNSFERLDSICWVHTHTFFKVFLLHFSHLCFN
ncbi:hypothetical protein HOG21_04705 [bacterium]|nr:hypothetical protein [bacterium]